MSLPGRSRIEGARRRTAKWAMIFAAVVERLLNPASLERLGPVVLNGQPEPIELCALA